MDFISLVSDSSVWLLGIIIPFLVVLTIVVFFHELGHYAVARWNDVTVEAFSVGFGPELIGFTDRNGTRWKLSAIPLGGYVKFLGDANAASAQDFEKINAMSDDEKAKCFEYKRVGQRAAVVAAGPIANFILAFFIFAATFMIYGQYVSDPVIVEVQEGGAAAEAGFQPGDIVRSIDGTRVNSFAEVARIVAPSPNRELDVVVERNGSEITLPVTPRLTEREDGFGNIQKVGIIGITNTADAGNRRLQTFGPLEACGKAVEEIWFIISRTMIYIYDIIVGRQSAEQLSGPIRIAKISGDVATLGVLSLINLAAILSVSIGLLNLFPVPLLDGGHLVYYAAEAVRGKPLSEKAQDFGYRIGLTLVLMLMLFATWNDITQLAG